MLFNKKEERTNEVVLYKTKPNMLLGCKKAIYGIVLLAIVLIISPKAIKFVGEMQVYLISHISVPLTRYAAIALFIVILFIILYIIWQLIGWYSLEYTLTNSRVIIKSGVLSTKKSYMPYATIQDINTSQSIFARMFNVGSISMFSAYDNNLMELSNISNPSEVEDIIFSNMMGSKSFQQQPRNYVNSPNDFRRDYVDYDDYASRNEYYDEFEPITPIGHERKSPRRDYEYYTEDLDFNQDSRNTYEYEPYHNEYEPQSNLYDDSYYDEVKERYSYGSNSNRQNNEPETYYDGGADKSPQKSDDDVDESSEKVIRRHFDKFKR